MLGITLRDTKMRKRLLKESMIVHSSKNERLCESTGLKGYFSESIGGKTIVKLPVTLLDKKNENGRVYPRSIMEGACRSADNDIKERKLLCTVDGHPDEPYVEPGNASHVVTRAWCEGAQLWNEWEVLKTSKGRDLQALIEANISFGVSIRGVGSCDNYGNVLDDYEFLGTDCVGEPSAKLWVAPEVIPNDSSARLSESSVHHKQLDLTMNNSVEIRSYIKEQSSLLEKDTDVTSKFQRVSLVEQALANKMNSVPLSEAIVLMNEWSRAKDSALSDKKSDKVLNEMKSQLNKQSLILNQKIANQTKKAEVIKKGLGESLQKALTKVKKLEEQNKKVLKVLNDVVQESKSKDSKIKASQRVITESAKKLAKKDVQLKETVKKAKELNKIIISESGSLLKTSIKEAASLLKSHHKKSVRSRPSLGSQMTESSVKSEQFVKESIRGQRKTFNESTHKKYKGSKFENPSVI